MQKTMSGLLAVWLSGFVFLLCCGMTKSPANAEFCPLTKAGNHCDKAKTKTNSPTFSIQSDLKFDCCGFLPSVFDKVRKLEKTWQTAQTPDKLKIDLPRFSFAESDFQIAEIYHPPDFNPQKIFIKNCVFRI